MSATERVPEPLHTLATRCLLHRGRLCTIILATYRVELTRTLNGLATRQCDEDDVETVRDIAYRIAEAAALDAREEIRREALHLDRRAVLAATDGTERAQGEMLLAGLQLIERILATAPRRLAADAESPAFYWN